MVKNVSQLACKLDLDQSECKSSQVNASAPKAWPNGVAGRFPIFINLTNPLRKTIYPQMYPKITKKISKTAQNVDMWNEQRDF